MRPANPFGNAKIGDLSWPKYEDVIYQSKAIWKVFTYNFCRQGICGYYFSQWHFAQQSDAGDIYQEIVKKSNRIRWVYSVENNYILLA